MGVGNRAGIAPQRRRLLARLGLRAQEARHAGRRGGKRGSASLGRPVRKDLEIGPERPPRIGTHRAARGIEEPPVYRRQSRPVRSSAVSFGRQDFEQWVHSLIVYENARARKRTSDSIYYR